MTMLKKVALLLSVSGVALFTSCSDDGSEDGASGTITAIVGTEYSGIWPITGTILADVASDASNVITNVAFTVTGAAKVVSNDTSYKHTSLAILPLADTWIVPNPPTSQAQSNQTFTVSVKITATFSAGGTKDTTITGTVKYDEYNGGEPIIPDNFVVRSVNVGGFSSNTYGSSIDVDAKEPALAVYKQGEIDANNKNLIDVVFSGTEIIAAFMVPPASLGGKLVGTTNTSMLIAVPAGTDLADVDAMMAVATEGDLIFQDAVAANKSWIVLNTDKGNAALITVQSITSVAATGDAVIKISLAEL